MPIIVSCVLGLGQLVTRQLIADTQATAQPFSNSLQRASVTLFLFLWHICVSLFHYQLVFFHWEHCG